MAKVLSDAVRMVTIAPELPSGLDAIRQVVDAGVVAALGHTDATYEQMIAGADAGATVATHLFNGMRPFHHRDPGPVGAALNDERLLLEVINDGLHLDPQVVRVALAAAGTEPDRADHRRDGGDRDAGRPVQDRRPGRRREGRRWRR